MKNVDFHQLNAYLKSHLVQSYKSKWRVTKEIIILHVVRSFVYQMQHVTKNVIYRRVQPLDANNAIVSVKARAGVAN